MWDCLNDVNALIKSVVLNVMSIVVAESAHELSKTVGIAMGIVLEAL